MGESEIDCLAHKMRGVWDVVVGDGYVLETIRDMEGHKYGRCSFMTNTKSSETGHR